MDWAKIAEIALTCIASVGGIGAIVVGIIKFSADIIAERLSMKYQIQIDKEKDRYKAELSKKEYVSKTRFDTEFSIYRELSGVFFTLVKDIDLMIPGGTRWSPNDIKDPIDDEYDNPFDSWYMSARESIIKAREVLYLNAAFIPQKFFDDYEEIIGLSKYQLEVFSESYSKRLEETRSITLEDYNRSREIDKKLIKLNEEIRDYLDSLEVL